MATAEGVTGLELVFLHALIADVDPVGAAEIFNPIRAVVDHPRMATGNQTVLSLNCTLCGTTDEHDLVADFNGPPRTRTIVVNKLRHGQIFPSIEASMVTGGQERTRLSGEPVVLRARDGVPLRGELFVPGAGPADPGVAPGPRVVVALSHAMLVDRRTLDQPPGEGLLSLLLAAGAAVLWLDQRGHGRSTPLPRQGASWDYDDLVDDAGVVAGYLAERFPGLPRVAVGHSLFGHVALAWQALVSAGAAPLPPRAATGPQVGYDGLVLLAANVWLPQLEPRRTRWWVKRGFFPLLVAAAWRRGYLPARDLRVGTADEPLPYLRQLGGWLGQADWTSQSGHSYLADLPAVQVPILSVAGAGDRLLAVPECQLRFACCTRGSVTHITVSRRHGYACEPDHMGLILDERLAPLWQQIAAWTCAVPRVAHPK